MKYLTRTMAEVLLESRDPVTGHYANDDALLGCETSAHFSGSSSDEKRDAAIMIRDTSGRCIGDARDQSFSTPSRSVELLLKQHGDRLACLDEKEINP